MEAENRGALHSLLEASLWDFPLALHKWMLGFGKDSSEVEAAVLKGCQAWTNLANQSMERLSQAQGFVGLMTSSVKHLVQYQRLARDFMESLAPAAASGKSGGGEIEEMREAVNRLRRDVRALTAKVNLMDRREMADAELH
jgi:methyl-accepting chemotaxis protein